MLTCSPGSAADADGDPVSFGFAWYIEGATEPLAATTSALTSDAFARGDTVVCTVTPFDGTDHGDPVDSNPVPIENTEPSIGMVMMAPNPARAPDALTCSHTGYSDADGDADVSIVSWTINGLSAGSGSLLESGHVGGDLVGCTVTPFDGESEGEPMATTLWVTNSAPSVASVDLGPEDAREGDTLTCTAGDTADADGDDVAIATTWNVNGADLTVSSPTLSSIWFNQGDEVMCTVTPTDGTDDGDSRGSDSVAIGNTLPVLASVDLSPAEPTEASLLTCTPGITTDADGTVGFGYEYAWIVNDIEVGAMTDTLTGLDFDRGDTVACRVTPNDGDDDGDAVSSATVTVQNTAPSIGSVAISPDGAIEADTLTCSYAGFADIDGDADLSTIAWTVNGIEAGTGAALTAAIAATDTVVCTVTPSDGDATGPSETASLVVGSANSAPEVRAVSLIPTTVTSTDTVTALVSTSDDDGDAVTLSYQWRVDGTPVAVTTASLDGAVFFDRGQEVTVTVTPNDGTTDGEPVASAPVIVQNSAPTVDDVTIAPDDPDASDALTCTYSGFADADADADSSTLQWTINGVPSGSSATLGTATAEDDLVVCTVTPFDGLALGAARTATVRIDADPDASDSASGSGDASGGSSDITLAIADYEFVGEGSDDLAGYSVANAGDVDGDGLDDLLVGARNNDDAGHNNGKTYLFYGKSLGDRARLNLARADYSFTGESSSDYSGASVASAGDVDGDGKSDILIGAQNDDHSGTNRGAAYLVLSSSLISGDGPDGRIEHTVSLSTADYKFIGYIHSMHTGQVVAGAGDIDGDGLADIMVNSYRDRTGGYSGSVSIFRASSLGDEALISIADADYIIEGENEDEEFGRGQFYSALDAAGDVDGDGLGDIIIGARSNDDAGGDAGMTYIFLGASFGSEQFVGAADADYRIAGAYGSDWSGDSVAGGGDIDGDGLSDVLIGAPQNPDGGVRAGAVYVVFGSRLGDEQNLDLYLDADHQLLGENDNDYAGQTVANAGDVDGDGLDDIVLGSQNLRHADRTQTGGVYVFLARDLGDEVAISLSEADQKILGEEDSDYAGTAVSGGGDFNGDGLDDVIVGAYGGESGGMTYLLFGE